MIKQFIDNTMVIQMGHRDVYFAVGVSYNEDGEISKGHITFSRTPIEDTKHTPKLDGDNTPARITFKDLTTLEAFINDLTRFRNAWEDREELQK